MLEYLDRWALSNHLFSDDVEIVGTIGKGSRIQIVISQKWIAEDNPGRDITEAEIDLFFESRHFARFISDGAVAYYNQDLGIVACDAHVGNFLRSKNRLVPIDVILGTPTEAMSASIAEKFGIQVQPSIEE